MLRRLVAIIICAHLSVFAEAVLSGAQAPSASQGARDEQSGIVTLPLLALDREGRPVMDLNQNELELYDGKDEQTIESMSRDPEAPAKIGFLIDISRSAASSARSLKLHASGGLAGKLLRSGDLAFVATFGERISLMTPFTLDVREVEEAIRVAFSTAPPPGGTSLCEAIYWACRTQVATQSGHKALVIFSDMEDSTSYHTREEALAMAQQSGTVIYTIVLGQTSSRGERAARSLASQTAGLSFTVSKLEALREVMESIRVDLANTFVLAYRPKSRRSATVKVRCARKGVRLIAPERRY